MGLRFLAKEQEQGFGRGLYPIALRAYSGTVPEDMIKDTDDDAIIVFLGVHKAGALMFLAKHDMSNMIIWQRSMLIAVCVV